MTIAARWAEHERLLSSRFTKDLAAVPARVTAGVTSRCDCPPCWSDDYAAGDDFREVPPGDIGGFRCSRTPCCGAPSGDAQPCIMPPSRAPSIDAPPNVNPSSGNHVAPPASMTLRVRPRGDPSVPWSPVSDNSNI